MISSVFSAATQPSSAPPKLDMCANPSSLSHPAAASLTRTALIGYMPPEMPLPVTRMSGTTPCLLIAHSSPVRISPVCTSSAMYSAPCASHSRLTPAR